MTQAVNSNIDILTNSALIPETVSAVDNVKSTAIGIDKTESAKFDKILDKTIATQENYTVGNIKNSNPNGDMSETIESFRDILLEAAQEVNMENALDLTLARDITEIISQLQSAISTDFSILNQESSFDIESAVNEVTSELLEEKEIVIDKSVKLEIDKTSDDTSLSLDEDMLNELNIESISAETDTAGNETMTNQQSAEEFGVKVMLSQNAEKLDFTFEKPADTAQAKPTEMTSEKIIEQLTKHFDSLKSTSKVNIVLNPESLGKVNLQIVNSKDGLTAQFTVSTNDARELLMKGLDGLKESLLTQGVSVDNISVKVSESEETYNPDWTEREDSEGGNKGQQQQNREEKEKGLFEKTIAESLKQDDNIV